MDSGLDETSCFFADDDGVQVEHGHVYDGVRPGLNGSVTPALGETSFPYDLSRRKVGSYTHAFNILRSWCRGDVFFRRLPCPVFLQAQQRRQNRVGSVSYDGCTYDGIDFTRGDVAFRGEPFAVETRVATYWPRVFHVPGTSSVLHPHRPKDELLRRVLGGMARERCVFSVFLDAMNRSLDKSMNLQSVRTKLCPMNYRRRRCPVRRLILK